MFYLEDVNN